MFADVDSYLCSFSDVFTPLILFYSEGTWKSLRAVVFFWCGLCEIAAGPICRRTGPGPENLGPLPNCDWRKERKPKGGGLNLFSIPFAFHSQALVGSKGQVSFIKCSAHSHFFKSAERQRSTTSAGMGCIYFVSWSSAELFHFLHDLFYCVIIHFLI